MASNEGQFKDEIHFYDARNCQKLFKIFVEMQGGSNLWKIELTLPLHAFVVLNHCSNGWKLCEQIKLSRGTKGTAGLAKYKLDKNTRHQEKTGNLLCT